MGKQRKKTIKQGELALNDIYQAKLKIDNAYLAIGVMQYHVKYVPFDISNNIHAFFMDLGERIAKINGYAYEFEFSKFELELLLELFSKSLAVISNENDKIHFDNYIRIIEFQLTRFS